MSSRLVTAMLLSCCLISCPQTEAQESKSSSDQYAEAVIAYFAKDYNLSDSVLTGLIEDGTGDPRIYYIRGLSRHAGGNVDAAEVDFEAGARLEYSGLVRVNVPRSLERVQGPVRQALEKYRRLAQRDSALSSRTHKKDRALLQVTANGKEAFLAGNHEVAVQLLDVAVANGSNDPRTYYFRGLAKQELGRSDEAAIDYKRAIGLELQPANRIDVDVSLESVQGEARLALKKYRHEAISVARQAGEKKRQAMIAALIEQRAVDAATSKGGVAIAKSAITLPPGASSPMPTATTPARSTTTPSTPANPRTKPPVASSNTLNVAWLPADAEVVVSVRLRELLLSPMLAALMDASETQASLKQLKDETGLELRDIESVTIGIRGATELAMTGAVNPAALESGKENVVIVVRLRLPFNPQVVERRIDDFEAATYDGKKFFRALDAQNTPCIYLSNSKTVVLAAEEQLKASIDEGGELGSRPEFEFIDSSRHLAVAFIPDDPFSLTETLPTEGSGSDALDRLTTAVKDQLLGVGLGVSLNDSLELEVRALCVDGAAATEVDASMSELMVEAKGLWAFAKAGVPTPIAGVVDSIIRAQKNSAQAEVASLSTRLSAQSVERAVEGAKEMLPMLMMGAMAGLGGNIPGGGGDFTIGTSSGEPAEPPPATKPAEGLTVAETAKMSSSIELDDDGNEKPKAIELVLAITGEQAKAAGGAGFASITSAKDNNGADLTLRVVTNFGAGGFEVIDRDDFFVKHPDDGCTAIVVFDPPAKAATEIASAEGIVKLRIVERSSQIVVDGAKSFLGKEVDNSELVAAGYKLKLEEKKEKFGNDEFTSWQLEWVNAGDSTVDVQQIADGGSLGLQTPQLVDADGKVIAEFSGKSYSSFGSNSSLAWSMTIQDDQPVPDDAQLRFTLNTEVSVVDVPFKVENVAIEKDDNGF